MTGKISKLVRRFFIFLAGAVIGAIISFAVTRGITGGTVQPVQAQNFLKNYFTEAVQTSSSKQAWQMLTPDFQNASQGGYDGFRKWYRNWSTVELGEVQPIGGNNQYMVDVTYISANNGPPIHGKASATLSCVDFNESYNPFVSTCSVKNIRMSYYSLSTVLNL
jgi:hypothetical protein